MTMDKDRWQEILHVLSTNKLRTILAAFGVFWGMFMLVALMGSGNGLENGVTGGFGQFATNSFFMWGQSTSLPYGGFDKGRPVRFTNDDTEALKMELDGAAVIAPKCQLGGYRSTNYVTRGKYSGSTFSVTGDVPEIILITAKKITDGRWLNSKDIAEKRKVAVIGSRVRDVLFEPGENPIGQYINISGIYFMVVGVHDMEFTNDHNERDLETIHTPLSTFQQAFNYGNRVQWYSIMAKPEISAAELEEQARKIMKERHDIHPEDQRAIGGWNAEKEFNKINGLFTAIKALVWFVGIGTLLAGVIGVSNIMLIVVKERTREIGIRKAIGATPQNIVSQIILEALVLTSISGYLGLSFGVMTLELLNSGLSQAGGMFRQPEIDFTAALVCLLIIIVAGALAGIIPARQAAGVNPIIALRTE
ncbi:MAG: ABC transporter permease [Salibacteraceae bacterium]